MTHIPRSEAFGPSRGGPRRLLSTARRRLLLPAVGLLVAAGVAACGSQSPAAGGGQSTATVTTRAAAASAPTRMPGAARLTQLDRRSRTLRAFAGRPLMVWFVANGCASCATSIPAVAEHLSAFAHAHVRVLVLGIYSAFGLGSHARAQLASFGRSAAGSRFTDPGWTWAVASAKLTSAYDPGAVPDEYVLLDRAGRTVYRGSVPVSTMGSLLTHLKETAA